MAPLPSADWPASTPTAIAIGNFDGVHAGHRAVLGQLVGIARELGVVPVAYTFDPAPTAVLAPERHQPRILLLEDRVRLLQEAGAEAVIVEPFTRAYAAQTSEWFAREVLGVRLAARALVVGYDFRFGAGRGGDVNALRALLPGVRVVDVAAVSSGAPVSSSRIRKLVAAGDVEEAAALLGRPHTLIGEVVHGDERGRTIGFPTANVANEVELTPADGVYAVRVPLDGALRGGVMNVGHRPTFAGMDRRFEVHLFDFAGDLYGRRLRVDLVARLRGEKKFASLDELRAQIQADAAAARAILG